MLASPTSTANLSEIRLPEPLIIIGENNECVSIRAGVKVNNYTLHYEAKASSTFPLLCACGTKIAKPYARLSHAKNKSAIAQPIINNHSVVYYLQIA